MYPGYSTPTIEDEKVHFKDEHLVINLYKFVYDIQEHIYQKYNLVIQASRRACEVNLIELRIVSKLNICMPFTTGR